MTQTYDANANKSFTPARLNRKQFGANIGGPLYVPHIYNGHDKTFSSSTGRLESLNGVNVQQAIVPDNSVRQGIVDSSALTSSSGKAPTVIDPISGHHFQARDHITGDPRSAIMMSVTPAPNKTNSSSGTNYNTKPVNTLNYQYDYIDRMDHTIGRNESVSGPYI